MADTVDQETIAYEPTRRRRLQWVVVAAILVALVVLTVVDRKRSAVESRALDRCAHSAGAALDHADGRLQALADYIAPAVDPPRMTPASGLNALRGLLSEEATTSTPVVQRAKDRCLAVSAWRWHGGHRQARAAYVALLQADLDRLARISDDAQAYYAGAEEVHRLRAEAESAWPVRWSSSP